MKKHICSDSGIEFETKQGSFLHNDIIDKIINLEREKWILIFELLPKYYSQNKNNDIGNL